MTLNNCISELARRKFECVEYNYDHSRSQMSKDVSKLSDKERFEMNRRRRLMNEEESKQKEKEAKSSQNGKCSECKEELIPPLKVYICQDGHLHREGQGKHKNKKVNKKKI